MIGNATYQKARDAKILTIVALIFVAIIASFILNLIYVHYFAMILMALMTLYVISPVLKKTT